MGVCNLAITLHTQLPPCSPTERGGQVTRTHHTHLSTVRTGAAAQQEEIGDSIFGNLQVLQLRRKMRKNRETSRQSRRGNLSWCVCPLLFAPRGNRGQEINSDIATWWRAVCLASSPPKIGSNKDLVASAPLQRTRRTLA